MRGAPNAALTRLMNAADATNTETTTTTTTTTIDIALPKPLGLILEEVQEGQAAGCYVLEVTESGSAAPYADQITSGKLATVMTEDVTALGFEDVMATILNAPDDRVELSFVVESTTTTTITKDTESTTSSNYAVGDPVQVVVQRPNEEDDLVLDARVGDNLRTVLLDGGFAVYQGLKQTLGNCGGAGQCTFCAVDIVESDGWDEERSEYEDQKLRGGNKFLPTARLACLNNLQGPVTIRKSV